MSNGEPPNKNKHPIDNKDDTPTPNLNSSRIWIIAAAGIILVFLLILANNNTLSEGERLTFNQLASDVMGGRVESITVHGGTEILVRYNDSDLTATIHKDRETNLFDQLERYGVTNFDGFSYVEESGDNTMDTVIQLGIAVVPTLLIVWLLWRFMRSMRFGQDQAISFGRSKARVARDVERPLVTFTDVAGAEEAKEEMQEIVEFLKEPDKFIRLGARVPKGVLLVGPPGTGKTLMARAVAGEAGVPFFSISGSEFVEMFVGVGASRVRDLFERAKLEAPAIVFVDEIDAVGRHRGAGLGGGHDEREQTLNQILVEMDGFETDTNIIIVAATNRPDILDPALLRPGRFDRKVVMDVPDVKGRLAILKVHAKGKPLSSSVNMEAIAKITAGFSGADLENLINEAAILAARRNKKSIGMSEMQESMERVVMGPERRSRVISEKEKMRLAYHEVGHAIMFHVLEHTDPVHKITIVSRGMAGGYTMSLPETERMMKSREEFEDDIAAAMGGRAAEDIVFSQFTTGAANDLQQATRIARAMVTQFGMSDELGPRFYGNTGGPVFLGRGLAEQRDYSEHYAEEIDDEVKRILQTAYQRSKNILLEYHVKLEEMVEVLMERETLNAEEFIQIMDGTFDVSPAANGE